MTLKEEPIDPHRVYDATTGAEACGVAVEAVTKAIAGGGLVGSASAGNRGTRITGRLLLDWIDAGMPQMKVTHG